MLKGNLVGGMYRRYLKAYFTLLSSPFKIPTDNSSLFWSFFLQTICIITHQILQWRIEFWHFFFPAKVNFVSVTKIIPNVESLVTQGDELITAALWTIFLHESIASSCVSLPALWRSGSGSFWKLPGRNQPSLNEANSDKSQRNIFIEVSGERICSFLFLERAWAVVLRKYYGG